jgi:hypothetical protein
LVELAEEGNDKERQKCSRLLAKFGGPEGYDRLVSAAVVSDCMIVIQKFINLSQASLTSSTLIPISKCSKKISKLNK